MHYLVKHSELEANHLGKIFLKVVQKALKQSLQYTNFQKLFGLSSPRYPRVVFVPQFALRAT